MRDSAGQWDHETEVELLSHAFSYQNNRTIYCFHVEAYLIFLLPRCGVLRPDHKANWPEATLTDLAFTLRDGVLLCNFLYNIDPTSIDMKDVNQKPQFAQVIWWFLKFITFTATICHIRCSSRSKAGVKSAIHGISKRFEEPENEGKLLIDAKKALNSLSRRCTNTLANRSKILVYYLQRISFSGVQTKQRYHTMPGRYH